MIYLSVGGNIGDTLSILEEASNHFSDLESSRYYRTKPWGLHDQPDFINAVWRIPASQSLEELFLFTTSIEKKYGKNVTQVNGPRTLDIDILFYKNQVIEHQGVTIPHPRWDQRLFVLIPLLDLTPSIQIRQQEHEIASLIDSFSKKERDAILCLDRSQRVCHAYKTLSD